LTYTSNHQETAAETEHSLRFLLADVADIVQIDALAQYSRANLLTPFFELFLKVPVPADFSESTIR
jgi:hypothetical protein